MFLSDKDITEWMKKGKLKIRPFKKGQIGSASVDLTLDNKFWFFKERYIEGGAVDLSQVSFRDAMKKIRAKKIMLLPGEMCLGITKEKITMPNNLMGRLEGRSKYARMGLAVHITSAVVQPGSDNHQVLEIRNNAPFSIILKEGMRISQVVFSEVRTPTSKPYKKVGKTAVKQ